MGGATDPNLANRYPGYAAPKDQSMITRDGGLGGGNWTATPSPTFDRASNPNAGALSVNQSPRAGSPRAVHPQEQTARLRPAVVVLRPAIRRRSGHRHFVASARKRKPRHSAERLWREAPWRPLHG